MVEKKVPYQVDGRQFEGMIVYDDSVKTKRPAIFMQPDWKGVAPTPSRRPAPSPARTMWC